MSAGPPSDLCVLQVMESTIGGTRRHLTDLARGLNARGVELHLAVAVERQASFRQSLQELERAGCHVHEIPMRRKLAPLADLCHLRALQRLLAEVRPDVVHTHSSKAGVLGRLASITTGIGCRVHTPHTFAFLFAEMFSAPKRRLFRELERWLALRSSAVVAVSPSEARTFERCGVVPSAKIEVLPNGIDPAPFEDAQPADLRPLGLDPARPTALVCGLLNVAKGQDLAIEALCLQPELCDLQLLVAGHGQELERLRELARASGVQERVAFAGFRTDVPELLAACDFLLLPSRWEGMPYIVLEAMAAARGVLATPVDGALDLLEDGRSGWLAREVSAPALAEGLSRVLALSHEERRAVGRAAQRRVRESFSEEGMVEGILALYARVLRQATT